MGTPTAPNKTDTAFYGPKDEASVRFVARHMAIAKMLGAGSAVSEPTQEQLASEMAAATKVVFGEPN